MPDAWDQLLCCSRKIYWFSQPVAQSLVTTPQNQLLYHCKKVNPGDQPFHSLPSEGRFPSQKEHFSSLWHLHLLSHRKRDPVPDASPPRGRMEAAFSWLPCKGEDDSESLFSFLLVLPNSPAPFQKAKHSLLHPQPACSLEVAGCGAGVGDQLLAQSEMLSVQVSSVVAGSQPEQWPELVKPVGLSLLKAFSPHLASSRRNVWAFPLLLPMQHLTKNKNLSPQNYVW